MSKGPGFERWVATDLSLWWTAGVRDDVFWRSQNSGGRATTRRRRNRKRTEGQAADIAAVLPLGRPLTQVIAIEAKRGYSKNTCQDLLDRGPTMTRPSMWQQWMDKVESEHVSQGTHTWALITRRDRRTPIIAMPRDAYHDISQRWPRRNFFILVTKNHGDVIVMLYEEWKQRVKPALIRKLAERI